LSRRLIRRVSVLEPPLVAHVESRKKYYDIWAADKPTELESFMKKPTCLRDFEEQTESYKTQGTEGAESSHVIAFVRLDSSPLQDALMAHCSDWNTRLIRHLNKVSHEHRLRFYQMNNEDVTRLREARGSISDSAELP